MKEIKTFRWFYCITAMLIILFAGILPIHAATISVTANAPDVLNGVNASCSLREAITNINNAATTYTDCAPTDAYFNTGPITHRYSSGTTDGIG